MVQAVANHEMLSASLAHIAQPQRERLAHIDFRLRFLGTVGRHDLTTRFGLRETAATRDLALYRKLVPQNIDYDSKGKIYRRSTTFAPLFEHLSRPVLTALTQGLGDDLALTDGRSRSSRAHLPCEAPTELNRPQLENLSVLTRAIHQQKVAEISYHSLSSGLNTRQVVPFMLVDNGLRWHIRAYDRLRARFGDFVINRVVATELLMDEPVGEHEQREQDIQWNRVVEMEIVPHPNLKHPETIAHEYGMQEGVLLAQVRAAVAGYVLRRWNVDCTKNHSLLGPEHHLWLRNWQALYGVANLQIAPGYAKGGKRNVAKD